MRDTAALRGIPRECRIVLCPSVFDRNLLRFSGGKSQHSQCCGIQPRYSGHIVKIDKFEQIALYRLAGSGSRPDDILVLVVVVLAPLCEAHCRETLPAERTVIATAQVSVGAIDQER